MGWGDSVDVGLLGAVPAGAHVTHSSLGTGFGPRKVSSGPRELGWSRFSRLDVGAGLFHDTTTTQRVFPVHLTVLTAHVTALGGRYCLFQACFVHKETGTRTDLPKFTR